MSRWCNIIHQVSPNDQDSGSPTPTTDEHMPPLLSPEEIENLDNYNNFMHEFPIRVEGGWPIPDRLPYDEELLHHSLGLLPQKFPEDSITKSYFQSKKNHGIQTVKSKTPKRNRNTEETASGSRKKIESDYNPTSNWPFKGPEYNLQEQQFPKDMELPFQQGAPLQVDNQKIN